MLTFLGKRLVQLIPTLFFVSLMIFLLQHLLPGDPAIALSGDEHDPAVVEHLREKFGFNRPSSFSTECGSAACWKAIWHFLPQPDFGARSVRHQAAGHPRARDVRLIALVHRRAAGIIAA